MRAWQIILILVCLVASFTAGYHIRGDVASDSISKTDTFTKVDTIHDSVPYPIYETLDREIQVPFPVYVTLEGNTVRDTVYVRVPITAKEYRTDDYRLSISGYSPSLDYIEIYRKTEYVTRTINRRWGVGVMAGYGVGRNGLSPYAGFGLFYRIW
jgi:hypothetical protein